MEVSANTWSETCHARDGLRHSHFEISGRDLAGSIKNPLVLGTSSPRKKHPEREKQRDAETRTKRESNEEVRQTDRQADRKIYKDMQTDGQTEIQMDLQACL